MLEVLQDFRSATPPLEWLLQTVPRLRPRLFSISSSLAAHPAQAHVTAAIVDWVTPFKRRRQVAPAPLPAAVHGIFGCFKLQPSQPVQPPAGKCSDLHLLGDLRPGVHHARGCAHRGWRAWTRIRVRCRCRCGWSGAPYTCQQTLRRH